MIRAFVLSLGEFGDPTITRIFLKSIALTLLIVVAIGAAMWFGTNWLIADWLHWGENVAGLAVIAEFALAFVFAWVLFRAVAIAVIGLFGDEIVIAVERRRYPEALATARHISFAQSLRMGLASAGRALVLNVVLIPAYILLLLTGIGTPILFFVANGWLLGRDLGEMVAVRHVAENDLKEWRASTRIERFGMGLIVSGLLSVPGINLFAPILGAAMAAHLFHGRTA
ncbi:MAG: EI24 domain-containing protein [Pseudomonadota bacterium]